MYQLNGKEFFLFKLIVSKNFFILHFEYGKPASDYIMENDDLDAYLNKLTSQGTEAQDGYRIKKIIKIYGHDILIIAKPKDKKYWLRSIALRDADDIIAEYIEARRKND
jgi:hypothetical protein